MLKGIFLTTDEIIAIVQDLTRQQEVITEIYEKVRDFNSDTEFSIYSEANYAKLLGNNILKKLID